jgi:hypothetical protein
MHCKIKYSVGYLHIIHDNRAGGTGNDGDINSVADCPICNSYNLENRRKIER